MYCDKCGKEINEGNFCNFCGCLVKREENVQDGLDKKKESKNRNYVKIIVLIIIIMLGIAVLLWLFFSKSDAEKFAEFVDAENYAEAASLLKEMEQNSEDEEAAKEYVDGKIGHLLEDYYASSITYSELLEALKNYEEMYPKAVEVAYDKAEELHSSQMAFTEAEELFEMGEFRIAQESYLKVIEKDDNYDIAQKKYNECYDKLRDLLIGQAKELAADSRYVQAVNKIDSEINIFREEDKQEIIQERNAIIEEYFTQTIESVEKMVMDGNYVVAIDKLSAVESEMETLTDVTFITDKKNEVINKYLDDVIALVENYVLIGDYQNAFKATEDTKKIVGNNKRVIEKEQEITLLYEQQISNAVYGAIDKREFELAAEILTEARMTLPYSNTLDELTNELAEYTPVSIYTMEPYLVGEKTMAVNSSVRDIMGNTYEKAYRVASKSDNGELYSVFDISKKYSLLTGVVAVAEESKGGQGAGHIRIYGDGILLWEDTNITSSKKSYEVSVNISGVTDLKIEMGRGGKESYNGVHVLFADVKLQK